MVQECELRSFDDLRDDLLRSISIAEERVRVSNANKERHKKLTAEKAKVEAYIKMNNDTANHMASIYSNVKHFLELKKKASKDTLEEFIRSVSNIIPDADLKNCSIKHEDNKTHVVNEKGQNINKREGSAARATMGLMLRYVSVKSMPNKIQLMFLDEALATLSSTSSVNLREVIQELSKDVGIVGIEQVSTLYKGIASKQYLATKQDKISKIAQVE